MYGSPIISSCDNVNDIALLVSNVVGRGGVSLIPFTAKEP